MKAGDICWIINRPAWGGESCKNNSLFNINRHFTMEAVEEELRTIFM
jgi:hypothetical protein